MKYFLFFLFYFPSLAHADSSSLIVQKLESSYNSIEDFEAEFEQEEINPLLEKRKKSLGVIYSLSKGKVFWYTKEPVSLKVISDGREIWFYYPSTDQLLHETWKKLDSQAKWTLLFLRREINLQNNFNIHWHNKKSNELEFIPKSNLAIEKIWITFSDQSGRLFFSKIVFFFPLGRKVELFLKNIKFNQQLLTKHLQKSLDENLDSQFRFFSVKKLPEK